MKFGVLLIALAAAYAQSPAFEVVVIKPSEPGQGSVYSRGGPGVRIPSPWVCHNMTLRNIVMIAFDVRVEQVQAPDWMNDVRFDITAKHPAGATREQLRPMLQNMLAERFGLKFHRESKEVAGFELVIGKNGPKLKPAGPPITDVPPPGKGGFYASEIGPDGYPTIAPGVPGSALMNNHARAQWYGITTETLAAKLTIAADKPVRDATGLTGEYDVSLRWVVPRPDVVGPDLAAAVQDQLGLKLEPKKVSVEIIVVDHAEKTPTEN